LVLTPPDKEDAENRHAERGAAARAKVNLFREGEIPDVCLSEYILIGKSNDRPVRHGSLKISFGAKFGVVRFGKKPSLSIPENPCRSFGPSFQTFAGRNSLAAHVRRFRGSQIEAVAVTFTELGAREAVEGSESQKAVA
jgi:hypothetical protein